MSTKEPRTNSLADKPSFHSSTQILNIDVGELSRLEIVDAFSPTSVSSWSSVMSPRVDSAMSPGAASSGSDMRRSIASMSSTAATSPHPKSIASAEDDSLERCFVGLARLQLHFKPTATAAATRRKWRDSIRRSSTKSTRFTSASRHHHHKKHFPVTENSNPTIKQMREPLNFVLKNLSEREQIHEYSQSIIATRARVFYRFSRVNVDGGFDEAADDAARRRQFFDTVWRKSQEFLLREIHFFRLVDAADAIAALKRRRKTKEPGMLRVRPSFMPNVFFELCADDGVTYAESLAEFLLIADIGENVDRGDVLMGLDKEKVDSCIVAISEFHAFSASYIDTTSIESMRIEEPQKRKENLIKSWISLKLLMLPMNEMLVEKNTEIQDFIHSTSFQNVDSYKAFGIHPVLCHGDFSAGNIFFVKDTNTIKSILDWKFTHSSTGLNDVARLLLTSVNSSLRVKHVDEWLSLYTNSFNAALKRHRRGGASAPTRYTPELVRRMFDAELGSQLLYAVAFLADAYERVCDSDALDDSIKDGIRTGLMGRIVHGFKMLMSDGIKSQIKIREK